MCIRDSNRDRLHLGSSAPNGEGSSGYYNDLRVYKGVAKYTSSFKVGSPNPVVIPNTPSGVSGGSKLTKITDGAVAFDGTGDYLRAGSSSDFAFGSGDFTIEFLIYFNRHTNYQEIVDFRPNEGAYPTLYADGNGIIYYWTNSANRITSSAVSANTWHHIALTRSGTSTKLFINGSQSGSTYSDSNTYLQSFIDIGASGYQSNYYLQGYVSNFRVIKGTALYTSSFTPPTRSLTNVTNTKLLCCQSNTLAGSAAVTPVTGNTGYTGTSQSITLNQANLNAGTVANVVDGSTSTSADIRDAGSFVELIFPQQQNGELQVNVSNGNDVSDDNIRVFIDGVEGTAFDVSSQSWHTIHTGNFTTVKLEQQGSTTGNIFGFRIGTGGDTIISKSVAPVGNAAATTFNPFNTDVNTIRGQETVYPTWNPLTKSTSTLSNGNLTITTGSGYPLDLVSSFTPAGRGQWYWEFTLSSLSGSNYTIVGMLPSDSPYKPVSYTHLTLPTILLV